MNDPSAPPRFTQANSHCLDILVKASESRELTASEDIRDHAGRLLMAQGQSISPALRERLVARRLLKPLESTLRFDDSVQGDDFRRTGSDVLARYPAIAHFVGSRADQLACCLAESQLSGAPQLLLSSLAAARSDGLEHLVAVALIAGTLALEIGMSDPEVRELVVAGLVHDIGELYVDPDLVNGGHALDYAQWRQVAVHPIVGSRLLHELGAVPPRVIAAVREHHERLDGGGYPAVMRAAQISPGGRVLGAAEVLAAILVAQDNPDARALLALRLVPGQFPREVVGVLARRTRARPVAMPQGYDPEELRAAASALVQTLSGAAATAGELQAALPGNEPHTTIAARMHDALHRLQMALHASGALSALDTGRCSDLSDPNIAIELQVVVRELSWRLRAMSRHLQLQAERMAVRTEPLRPLLMALDPAPSSED